jgi:hypothetical protein
MAGERWLGGWVGLRLMGVMYVLSRVRDIL